MAELASPPLEKRGFDLQSRGVDGSSLSLTSNRVRRENAESGD